MFNNFSEMVTAAQSHADKRIVAVAAAEDAPVLEAVLRAHDERIAEPILIGDSARIKQLLRDMGRNPSDFEVQQTLQGMNAGESAVEVLKAGKANFLMKGLLDTKDLLKPVVKKENGLNVGRVMSHLGLFMLPTYHKIIGLSDAGMLVYPALEEKKAIIENATRVLRHIGYEKPRFAVLAAVEKVNPKMRETVDGAALQEMSETGELADCIAVGPISYDVAMDKEIAHHKGYENPYAGDFDALIVPDISAGNILSKCWTVSANALLAGIIAGARVPIVLTSRGSTAEEKYYSIAFAALASEN